MVKMVKMMMMISRGLATRCTLALVVWKPAMMIAKVLTLKTPT